VQRRQWQHSAAVTFFLFWFSALRCSVAKKVTAAAVAFFFFLWSSVVAQHNEEGDGSMLSSPFLFFLQHKKATTAMLPSPSSYSCFVTLHCNATKKATAVAIAFFFLSWSCTATQHIEEGDASNVVVALFFFFCNARRCKLGNDSIVLPSPSSCFGFLHCVVA
jgi:hypothetical protein